MWNKENPINMLSAVNQEYEIESIKAIQKHIDIDKFLNSYKLNFDLCGYYAPFCDYCSKIGSYPCANAYFKFKDCTNSTETVGEILEKAHPTMEHTLEALAEESKEIVKKEEVKEQTTPVEEVTVEEFVDDNFEQLDIESLTKQKPVEEVSTIVSDDPFIDEPEIIEQVTEQKHLFRLAVAKRKNI